MRASLGGRATRADGPEAETPASSGLGDAGSDRLRSPLWSPLDLSPDQCP
jgi:hypothetical protein